MLYLDISNEELVQVYKDILTFLGAENIDVDLTKEEIKVCLRRALNKFEKEISVWQIQNQWGNMYGTIQGSKQVGDLSKLNFSIVQEVSDWFASMGRFGGKIPWHKDYIILEGGRQIYDLSKESSMPYKSGTRRIHKVMWVAKPESFNFGKYSPANQNGDDVLYSNNWGFGNGGLSYGGNNLNMMGNSSDMVMFLQARENMREVMFSEFFYNISGDILEVTPMPTNVNAPDVQNLRVFYYYWNEAEIRANGKDLSLDEYSYEIDEETGMIPGQSGLIANPLDIKFDSITWSGLSPWAKGFVFEYAFALAKYIQASKWRKIQKTMSGGEMNYEVDFDYSSLLSESDAERNQLINDLRLDLEKLNLTKIFEDKRSIFDNAKRINTGGQPKIWKMM